MLFLASVKNVVGKRHGNLNNLDSMKLEVDSFKTGDLDVMQLHLSGKTKHRWICWVCWRGGQNYIQPFYYAFKYLVIYRMIWMGFGLLWCLMILMMLPISWMRLIFLQAWGEPRCFAWPHISQFGFRICNKAWMGMVYWVSRVTGVHMCSSYPFLQKCLEFSCQASLWFDRIYPNLMESSWMVTL